MYTGKKILCFALAMATTVPLMFAGCSKPATSSATGSSSSPASSSSEAQKPIVTLSIMTGDKTIQGLDRVTKAVNDYLASKNYGLAIKWETYGWDDLSKKTTTMLQTGQPVDVINTASWIAPGYVQHAQDGEFTDLTKYVTDPQYADVVSTIGKDFLDGTKVNGKYWGMPTNKEKAHNFGFLAQTDELTKLGIDPKSIHSLDDMAKYFDKVKADGLIPICAAQMDSPYKFLDWDAFDADLSPFAFDPSDETTVVDPFTAAKTVAFYNEMKTFNQKGYFSPDILTSKGEETDMATGKYFCGSWSLMPGKNISESTSLKLKLTQIDITPVEKTNRETLGALLAIPKTSTHPDDAFKFISLLYTDKDLINLMTYGVPNQDYTKVSDNVIKINPSTDFNGAGPWIMGNEFNDYLTDTQPSTLYTDINAWNNKAKVLTDLGFVFDNSKVKTQYAACQGVVQKYYQQLFCGAVDNVNSTVASFSKDLDAAGEQTLLKEVQTQYDAWKQANGK